MNDANGQNETINKAATYLASIEIWVVTAVFGASLVLPRLLPIAVVIIAVFGIIRWLAFGYLSKRTPADWAIALLLLMVPITLLATASPDTTRIQVYRLLVGIGLYYAIVNWTKSGSKLRLLIIGTALAGMGLAFVGLVSVEWTTGKIPLIPDSIYKFLPTLVSDRIHRNVMAGVLVLLLPCPLSLLLFDWKDQKIYERLVLVFSALVMLGVLILTQSRGGGIAIASILGGLIILRWRWGWLFVSFSLIIGFIIGFLVGFESILEAIIYSNTIGGVEGRMEIWSRAIIMIQDFPLTGVGMGNFADFEAFLYPFFLTQPGSVPHAHNLYLQIGVDLGISGLVSWLAIILLMVTTSWQVYQQGREKGEAWLIGIGAGLFCSHLALVIHGTIDSVTWGMVRPAPIVWALWGLTAASGLITIQTKYNPERLKRHQVIHYPLE